MISKVALRAAAIFVVTAAVCTGLFVAGFRVNHTPSMPEGLYRLEPVGQTSIARDETVAACFPDGWRSLVISRDYVLHSPAVNAIGNLLRTRTCSSGLEPILKRVVAIHGDVVTVDRIGVRINGLLLVDSVALAADSQGRPLPQIPFGSIVLRKEELWLAGDSARSLDSRYFGPVLASSVIGRVRPILAQGAK